jgi:hypothetical protein
MSDKKIVWEKWIDPLNSNVDEVEYPGYNSPLLDEDERTIEFLSVNEDFEEKFDEHNNSEEQGPQKNMVYNPIRIVQTPHGFVTLTEHSFASKSFDFWTMHYNHDITDKTVSAIEECPGVESVNAITRYRVRIGFNRILLQSKAFNLNEIRKNVEEAVLNCGSNVSNEWFNPVQSEPKEIEYFDGFTLDIAEKIEKAMEGLKENKFWAMYVFPNGNIESISESEVKSKSFEEKALFFKEMEKMVGGKALFSKE